MVTTVRPTSRGAGPPPATEPSEWPNKPVYLCAHPDIKTKDYKQGAPLPLNEFVEFESELFVGKIMIRLKPNPPKHQADDVEKPSEHADESSATTSSTTTTKLQSHEEYFKKAKTHFQFVLQGRFKEEILFSELCLGDCYEKPFNGVPKGLFMRMYERFMESVYPLTVMDIISDRPVLFTPLGSVQIMRVDLPGNEPDVSQHEELNNIQEDTTLLFANPISPPKKPPREGTATNSARRRGHLSKAKHAVNYKTNPDHVYTIECCDDAMCFGSYYQHALGFKIDMARAVNGQALAFAIMRRSDLSIVCKFPVWHERLIEEMKKAEEISESDDPTKESTPAPDRVEPSDVWQHHHNEQESPKVM